jgi:hypothetical protein
MFERNIATDHGYVQIRVEKDVIRLNGQLITIEQAKRISDALLDAEYMVNEEMNNG